MSMDGDSIRPVCPACDFIVETEGYGIPAYVLDADGTVYHAKCAPGLCTHEKEYVYDWKSYEDNDETVLYHRCRSCGTEWDESLIGSLVRAEGEANAETD